MNYQPTHGDIELLEAHYQGRRPFRGEMHDHSASGGTSDGLCTLTEWKEEMAALHMDFAAILDHRQVRHMYLPEWDQTKFLCGSEPGTLISDSKGRGRELHYLLMVPTPGVLEDILADVPEFGFEGGPEGHFVYPFFTTERFREIIDVTKRHGGMFVIPHPKQFLFSDDPFDYWFRDWTGLEAVYNSLDSAYTVENTALWLELLKLGKHVWACAGGDKHNHAHDEALTTVYAPEMVNSAVFDVYKTGDFTCGPVGIRMVCGETPMGGMGEFEGRRLAVSVGDFHVSVKNPSHTYRFDLYDDKGLVFSTRIPCDAETCFALDADKTRAFYRAEVWDETRDLRLALGNPIWNAAANVGIPNASYYARGRFVERVPFSRMDDGTYTVGPEPAVPPLPHAAGVWEKSSEDELTGCLTFSAKYTFTPPEACGGITLDAFGGREIHLCPERVREFLGADEARQAEILTRLAPKPDHPEDHQNTRFSWTDNGENRGYTVYFFDADRPDAPFIETTDKTCLDAVAGIFTPGHRYTWYVCGNESGACSQPDTFTTTPGTLRYITAGTVGNVRDVGGRVNAEGRRVRYGLLYRGGAMDECASYIDDRMRNVFNFLGIRTEIELRGEKTHPATWWDENSRRVFRVKADGYQRMLSPDEEGTACIRAAFNALADAQSYPVYCHCSAGADRTGTFIFLLYGLLGVPYADVRTDYQLTSFSRFGVRNAVCVNDKESLDDTRTLILDRFGDGTGDLRRAVENYLVSFIRLPRESIDAIRQNLLE